MKSLSMDSGIISVANKDRINVVKLILEKRDVEVCIFIDGKYHGGIYVL